MAGLVIDCSVALSWMLPDEDAAGGNRLQRATAREGALAPAHWPLEVANGLMMALRRGRIDAGFREAVLGDLSALPIILDAETPLHAWTETSRLADAHDLTIYDAAYLELAARRALPLATLDCELRAAAEMAGVAVFG